MSCDERHCVTCADEAVPLRVLALGEDGVALCEGGVEVLIDLVAPVVPGEELLVHAGTAIGRAS